MGRAPPSAAGGPQPPPPGRVPSHPLYSNALVRLVAVFGIGTAIAVAAATAAALWAGRGEAVVAAERATASLARPLTEAVALSINSVDVTLTSVADLAIKAGLDGGSVDLAAAVGQRLLFTPHLRQILVVAADGRVLFDSAGAVGAGRLDITATLEEHRRLPRPLVIGGPVEGRFIGSGAVAGQTLIPISRAVTRSNGTIAALVIAAVNPETFRSGFGAIEEESGVRVRLWRFDGTLLADVRSREALPVIGGAELPLFSRYLKAAEIGTFTDVDEDGILRVTSYRTTLAWPLVVSVGMPMDVALGKWRENVHQVGWPVVMVTLVVLGMTGVLVRTLARRAGDEAALRLSDRVLSNVSNGVAIADAHDPALPLLYVNAAFERITGYSAAEVVGRNARFLHADLPGQPELDDIRAALAAGTAVTVTVQNVRSDGGRFWNQLSLSPVLDPAGTTTHWVGVQRDITKEVEAHAALSRAYDDVAGYSADLERFSFVLAHHLQEPARQMRLQAQVLLQRLDDSAEAADREPAELIVEASARLIDLLRDVQIYLAIEGEVDDAAAASSELALAAAVNRFAARTPKAPLAVETGNLPWVGLSQKRLDDLFEILVENAIAFRHPDRAPRIAVTVEPSDGQWLFSVADNGIGIGPGYFERIFVPLERLHDRSLHQGTGIGLAVARKIVKAAGGRIWVESDGLSGSTFRFTLPMTQVHGDL